MKEYQLNATAASLLGFLHDGPRTGWDLVATAEQVIGEFWSLTQSQVYRELAAMATAGLVTAGEPGRRERKPYSLTDTGREAFADWIDTEPGTENIRFPLLLTVAFGRHLPPERLARFLSVHRARHARKLADYRHQRALAEADRQPADPYAGATLDFGLIYEQAVLDWFDQLPDTLTTPTTPRRLDEEPGTTTAERLGVHRS
jgi:DNA-binding PadR family transcriptional regulator